MAVVIEAVVKLPLFGDEMLEHTITISCFVVGWTLFRMFRGRFLRPKVLLEKGPVSKACSPKTLLGGTSRNVEAPVVAKTCDDAVETMSAHARLQELAASLREGSDNVQFGYGVEDASDTTYCPSDEDDEVEQFAVCNSNVAAPQGEMAVEGDLSAALQSALDSSGTDTSLAVSIVDSVIAAGCTLCGPAWIRGACLKVQASGMHLSFDRASMVLHALAHARCPELAVDVFLASCLRFESTELYSMVLDLCASCGDFESATRAARSVAWKAPDSMVGSRAFLALTRWLAKSAYALGPALASYSSARQVVVAVGSSEDLHALLATGRLLLKACATCGDMTQADALFQELFGSGESADSATFVAMVRGHHAVGRYTEAISYFELMKVTGFQPDESLYGVALECGRLGEVPMLLEQVLQDMKAAGVTPTNGTLTTILKLYGQSCNIDRAVEIFEELPREYGFCVDERAHTALVSACLRSGRVELALQAFDQMTAEGKRLESRVYNALVIASAKHGDLDRSIQLVEKNLEVVEEASVGVLLRVLVHYGEAARLGHDLLNRLQSFGIHVPEPLVTRITREGHFDSNC